jgi:4-carboxymuconolactone decarboxylase
MPVHDGAASIHDRAIAIRNLLEERNGPLPQRKVKANERERTAQEGPGGSARGAGADHVDASLAAADDFLMAFQRLTTEWCWGHAWTRPGLDRRTRSLLNLAMLTALNRPAELRLHVKGTLTNGVTAEEVKEVLLQATVYCGIPAGLEAFKAAHEVLKAEGVLPQQPAQPSP